MSLCQLLPTHVHGEKVLSTRRRLASPVGADGLNFQRKQKRKHFATFMQILSMIYFISWTVLPKSRYMPKVHRA